MFKVRGLGAAKLVAVASSIALVGGLAVAGPAAALNGGGYVEELENATLTWQISPCAFDPAQVQACGSIQQDQSVTGNVTKESNGWVFSKGTGTRDTGSGNVTVDYTGTITLGNTGRGTYKIKISNPSLTTAGDAGTLKADVQYLLPKLFNDASNGYVSSPVQRVTVLELQNVSANGNDIAADSATPADPRGSYSSGSPASAGFDTDFTDFLATAATLKDSEGVAVPGATSLAPFFMMTSNGASGPSGVAGNNRKVASSLTAAVSVAPPKIELVGASGIPVNKSKVITVKGTGFNPQYLTDAGAPGLYVFFGPDFATMPGGYGNYENMNYVKSMAAGADPTEGYISVDSQGKFTATIKVEGIFEAGGKKFDARKDSLGITTFGAHGHSSSILQQFQQIRFTSGAVSYSKPGKVKRLKRGKTTKRTLKLSWQAPSATTVEFRNNKAIVYQVRATNSKGKRYGKWVKVSLRKHSYTFKNLKKGKYKFQVRAISGSGAGAVTTYRYKKRK